LNGLCSIVELLPQLHKHQAQICSSCAKLGHTGNEFVKTVVLKDRGATPRNFP